MDLSDHGKEQRNQYMREYNAKLSDEAKAAKAEYQRQYRRRPENKEKLKVYQARFWEKKAQQAKDPDTLKTDSAKDSVTTSKDSVTSVTPEPDTIFCQYCHNEFTPARKTAKFCSDSCRVTYNRILKSLKK